MKKKSKIKTENQEENTQKSDENHELNQIERKKIYEKCRIEEKNEKIYFWITKQK